MFPLLFPANLHAKIMMDLLLYSARKNQPPWKCSQTWTQWFQLNLGQASWRMAKALIQAVLAIASRVASKATKDQQQDNLGVFLLATVAKVATTEAFTQADDRSWYSLPKQILVQKVPTPQNGKLSVRTGSNSEVSFEVNPNNQTNFVYLKSIRRGNPIKVISSFGFGGGLGRFCSFSNIENFLPPIIDNSFNLTFPFSYEL